MSNTRHRGDATHRRVKRLAGDLVRGVLAGQSAASAQLAFAKVQHLSVLEREALTVTMAELAARTVQHAARACGVDEADLLGAIGVDE